MFKRDEYISFREKWTFVNVPLEIVNGFTYKGLYFSNRMSFIKCLIVWRQKRNAFRIKHTLKYLTEKIAPIMLYGAELWAFNCAPSWKMFTF